MDRLDNSVAQQYANWYESTHKWVKESTPRVGILLYRKHVVTGQGENAAEDGK